MCKQTLNRLQALFNHTKCDTVKNLPLSTWALRILHICPIRWVLSGFVRVATVLLLSCTVPVSLIIEEAVRWMTSLLRFMYAEAQQELDSCVPAGPGGGLLPKCTMQYSRPLQ